MARTCDHQGTEKRSLYVRGPKSEGGKFLRVGERCARCGEAIWDR